MAREPRRLRVPVSVGVGAAVAGIIWRAHDKLIIAGVSLLLVVGLGVGATSVSQPRAKVDQRSLFNAFFDAEEAGEEAEEAGREAQEEAAPRIDGLLAAKRKMAKRVTAKGYLTPPLRSLKPV